MLSAEWHLQHFHASDVDELSMALPGWTQHYTQLERGRFRGALTLAHGQGMQVCREHTEGALLQEGETHNGMLGLAIPMRASGATYSFGTKLPGPDAVMGFFEPRRLNLRTPGQFELLVVSVQREVLDDFDQSRHPATGVTGQVGPVGRLPEWLRLDIVDAMLVLLTCALPAHRMPAAKAVLLDCLAEALLRFEPAPERAKAGPCRETVNAALARVRAWMHERPDVPLNVAALCAEMGLPRRTLQYCFEQALGVTPLQYLKSVRLSGARRCLKDGRSSVLQACLQWGFDHPSAFARDYQLMFGELPSQTQQRGRSGQLAHP